MQDGTIAASTVVTQPVPIGLPTLARLAFNNIALTEVRTRLATLCAESGNPGCLLDLATLEMISGNAAAGLRLQHAAITGTRLFHRPTQSRPTSAPGRWRGNRADVRLLVVMGSGPLMANTPIEFLLEGSGIAITMAFCHPGQSLPDRLPPHDAVFVAIGESDEHQATLAALAVQLADWPMPVINRPAAIARTGRVDVAAALRDCPGLVAPALIRVDRKDFLAAALRLPPVDGPASPGMKPVLARPVQSHAGLGLERLTTPQEAAQYLADHPDPTFYLSSFVDYADAAGIFRKYRIAFVGGVAYPSHMAISSHWMIHYLNACMHENPGKRAEEARWMTQFEADFIPRHRSALAALVERIGLDYIVVDCGETRAGDLLIFEVDSAMLVHAMDHPALFAYKQAPMQRLFSAMQEMIVCTAFASSTTDADRAVACVS